MENTFEKDQEIVRIQKDSEILLSRAESLQVNNSEDQKTAAELLDRIKKIKNVVNEKCEYYVKPIKEIAKGIKNRAENILDQFMDAKRHISDELRKYDYKLREEKRKQDLKDRLRKRKEAERKRQENRERQKLLKSLVTNVAIKGNSVLVPVKVTYGFKDKIALLVLDTEAEIVVLHKEFADQLNIRPFKKSKATVASGKSVPVGIAKLSSIEVGPHKKSDLAAAIINPVGKMHHNGLLGMNFLRYL